MIARRSLRRCSMIWRFIFAGFAAKRMGLPIDRLVIATNSNDILHRTLETGRYEVRGVAATSSPSMDIQVSSNFERLVYLAYRCDAPLVRTKMDSLKQSGTFSLDGTALAAIRAEFDSGAASELQVSETIRQVLAGTGELLDPHTAAGYSVAQRFSGASPMVTFATAHPAKFPEAVEKACGQKPSLPSRLGHLPSAKESFTVLPNDQDRVKTFILDHQGHP
jgi:threonine synthase